MPIDQLANYAEVFGGIAVIVSLIYLAFQVRANTIEQRHRRRTEIFEIKNTIHDFMAGPENMSESFVKAARDFDSLTEAELIRFSNMYQKVFNALDLMIDMQEDKEISKEALDQFEKYVASSFTYPGTTKWWENTPTRAFLSKRICDRVDGYIAAHRTSESANDAD